MTGIGGTIVAVASGRGGAIALIRLSGPQAIIIADTIFTAHSGLPLTGQPGYTLHYGKILDGERVLDDVLVSLFRAPNSFSGEDMAEISCHASPYIQQEILRLCLAQGARPAQAGEFTLRAFLAGKMDLSQAEAVADIIAADSRASHALAMRQIRGRYSEEFALLRERLIELVSLLELELDFGEEEVEFADREQIASLMEAVGRKIGRMQESFRQGNVLKNGVPVAIAGSPNVGKSTLLNALVGEERALVSDIAGTTRDLIEDTVTIDGVFFRFIDTAGIRQTDDPLETMGIERTFRQLDQAAVVIIVTDARDTTEQIMAQYNAIAIREGQRAVLLLNKADLVPDPELSTKCACLQETLPCPAWPLSAKYHTDIESLTAFLLENIDTGLLKGEETVVFNARHHAALRAASDALSRARAALDEKVPGDLLAQDIREALHHLGTITGDITTDDILRSIFSKFCIGK